MALETVKPIVTDVNNNKVVTESIPVKEEKVLKSMDDFIEHANYVLKLFFTDKSAEAIAEAEKYASVSLIHNLALNTISLAEIVMNMSKTQMKEAIVSTQNLINAMEHKRYPKSYKNLLIRPDYNLYTDEHCYAELAFAFNNLLIGAMLVLSDESVYGFVNAGYRVNIAYRVLAECEEIFKTRVKWESANAKDNFECLSLIGNGAFEMMISFFPSKLTKLLEYLGFSSNQQNAMQNLHRAASLTNTFGYYLASFILCAYYGFATCFYGIGELNIDFMEQTSVLWRQKVPNGSFFHIGTGALEMAKGHFEEALGHFQISITKQEFWPQMHFICFWSQAWCYAFMGRWEEAAVEMKKLKEQCKWAPSLFNCMYAMFKSHQYNEARHLKFEDKDKQKQHDVQMKVLAKEINETLTLIPTLKRKLGGIHVFHEELSLSKHKKYLNNAENWHLPIYELIYVWNFMYLMRKRPELLENIITSIDKYEKTLVFDEKMKSKAKNDVICYLKFIKASCHRHLNQNEQSIKLFEEVLQFEGKLKSEKHLIPQTFYELGILNRESGDKVNAKKYLKKVKSEYSGYFTESMFTYRVDMVLDAYRREKPKKI